MSDFLLRDRYRRNSRPHDRLGARRTFAPHQRLAHARAPGRLARHRIVLHAPPHRRFGAQCRPSSSPMYRSSLPAHLYKIAFKDGVPTPAAEAFARKAGVPVASAGENLQRQGRISRRHRAEEGPRRQRNPGRTAAQRNRRNLLGQVACTGAAKPPSASSVLSAGWSLSSTTRSFPSNSEASPPATPAKVIAFSPAAQSKSTSPRTTPQRSPKNFVTATSAEREHTHPQGPRRRHPHRSRRALARRQVAARHRRESDRMPSRHPRQLRSRISSPCPPKCSSPSCATTRSTSRSKTPTASSRRTSSPSSTPTAIPTASSATATSAFSAPASTTPVSSGTPTRKSRSAIASRCSSP